ncbi:coenzyme F420-0:L-glutamate ligase [Aquamicrobium ahrensii]|uniref:3-phospho-D-glycerate guanylyltransferase n=1 Tax=Aquamicrobium ahrensii TaxID=469551 RepID=A0ABV2KMW6_9HYPH
MTVAIAILMKDPAEAKTRLKSALGNDARETLALLLFENTLGFFRRFHGDKPLAVVTPSERVAEIARAHEAVTLGQNGKPGINGAADRAAEWAASIGAERLLVIHADIPTLEAAEIASLIEAGCEVPVVVAESYDGGSNAILLSPPDAIPFRFGPGSAGAHEAAARSAGKECLRLALPNLRRDIDTPRDLLSASTAGCIRRQGVSLFAVAGIPEIGAGDDLSAAIAQALSDMGGELKPRDIVIVAQKIVSKSEARMFPLDAFAPSDRAREIAAEIGKDARKVEAILSESTDILRARRQEPDGLLITRHRQGWICANAGIDQSNLGEGKDDMLLLLPEDPDASAARIKAGLETRYGGPIGVVVTDTFGRPWRHGLVNVAIGVAGVPAVVDWTVRADAYGRGLKATLPAFADELAAASGLLMQKDAGLPVVIIRGLPWSDTPSASAGDFLRPLSQELFL